MDEMRRKIEECQNQYGDECIKELEGSGLGELTRGQAIQILEPEHGPENFMCDGEISHATAMRDWKQRLSNLGLTPTQITKAKKRIFG